MQARGTSRNRISLPIEFGLRTPPAPPEFEAGFLKLARRAPRELTLDEDLRWRAASAGEIRPSAN